MDLRIKLIYYASKLHTKSIDNIHSRKAWRHQRRNSKPWIVIGQTTQRSQDTKEVKQNMNRNRTDNTMTTRYQRGNTKRES